MKNKDKYHSNSLKSYQEGLFVYNECFSGEGGFLTSGYNEEKHMISAYLQALAEELSLQKVLFGGTKEVHWLEPGIGNGLSTRMFLEAMGKVHTSGFVIHGSDYQDDAVKEARSNLEEIDAVDITVAELLTKDAFSGERLSTQLCDVAILSHFIYHAKTNLDGGQIEAEKIDARLESLVRGVTQSLKPDGLALAFHESSTSDHMSNIGFHYGSAMNDATDRLATIAAVVGKTIVRMPLDSKLYFPELSGHELESLKTLSNWKRLNENSAGAHWVKKLLFALHNVPQSNGTTLVKHGGVVDLAGDVSTMGNETRLGDAIDYVKSIFQRNERGPYIVIRSEMQAILNNPAQERLVRIAFDAVEKRLPEIRREAQQAMDQVTR